MSPNNLLGYSPKLLDLAIYMFKSKTGTLV